MNNKKILTVFIILIVFISILTVVFIKKEKTKLKELTTEEKLEDFRYMYNILEENYPHFYEVKKIYKLDWLAAKEYYEKKIEETENNIKFFFQLNSILNLLNDHHAEVIPPDFYYSIFHLYRDMKEEDGEEYKTYKPWIDIFLSAEGKYRDWYKIFKEEYPDFYENEPEGIPKHKDANNIVTKIIEDKKIAYFKIKSFSVDSTEEIMKFLKDVKNYPYLIIDIRDNSGGNTAYWEKIISSLLNEPITIKRYCLIRGGEYSMENYYSKLESDDLIIDDIKNYPYYDDLPNEIKDDFKYYILEKRQFSNEDSIGFKGQIFLLVNEYTFSAADNLVNVCKQIDTVTVIGCKTAGGGIGFTPLYVKLPNSGLIVRFEGEIGLNEDGTSNFMGINPDIEIKKIPGEDYEQKVIKETINLIYSMEKIKGK